MGGILLPNTKISGAAANPGIPLANSPSGGLFETDQSGVGIALDSNSFFELDAQSFRLGYKPITAYNLQQVAGSPFATATYPVYSDLSPDGAFLYVTHQGLNNDVSAYAVNSTNGTLTEIAGSPFAVGTTPYNVKVTPDGNFLIVANNGSHNISVFSRDLVTGALTPVAGSPFNTTAYPHALAVTPDNKHVLVTHDGAGGVDVYTLNSISGALALVANYATGNGPYSVAISASGNFAYVANSLSNSVSVFSINAITGVLTPIVGSPFATGINPYCVALSPDDLYAYVVNKTDNTISVFAIDSITGALTVISGSPYATGASPYFVVVSPDGNMVYAVNQGSANMSAFLRNITTGTLAPIAGSPFATGNSPFSVHVSPDSAHVFVNNENGASISVFQTSTEPTFNLISILFDKFGGLAGGMNINGRLQVLGQDLLTIIKSQSLYAALTGLITQPFSAKTLTLDHAAGGLIGTPTADNAIAGAVGEYIESIVLLAAAVNLATGVTANVTSINLTDGDWDIEGVISFHGDGTTNINDVKVGTNNASAAFGGVGTYQSDYLTIVVAAGIDATYIAPKHRFSLAAPATVYLVALAHFTISTCTAYGKISARRVR